VTTKEALDERYGRRRRPRGRRIAWSVVILVALTSVAALAWTTVSNALDDVGFDGTGYEVVDEHTVTVTFEVSPPHGADFACAIQALDEDFGVVGWRVIENPALDTNAKAFIETIPTLAMATTGVVESCGAT
jgi:hypothetical protein